MNDLHYEQNQMDPISSQDTKERILEIYDSEKKHANDRWEQEQLEQFEGFVILEQLTLINDEI